MAEPWGRQLTLEGECEGFEIFVESSALMVSTSRIQDEAAKLSNRVEVLDECKENVEGACQRGGSDGDEVGCFSESGVERSKFGRVVQESRG